MPSLGMGKSFELTYEEIDRTIVRVCAGNYALGHLNSKGTFIVQYVGRSETDLAARLKQHVGAGFERFKYKRASSPSEVFYTQCRNYHDFGGKKTLRNLSHPDRPAETRWKCPCCGVFD